MFGWTLHRALWVILATALAVTLLPAEAGAARKAKRCKPSQPRETVSYVKKAGGRRYRVTGCGPRRSTFPATLPGVLTGPLQETRRVAAALTPATYVRLGRGPAARGVLRAAPRTDAALADSLARTAGTPTARRRAAAGAASVTTGSDSRSIPGPAGTRSTLSGSRTDWAGNERQIGMEFDATTETKSVRIKPSATVTETLKAKILLDRCPDSKGIARGVIDFSTRERQTTENADGGRVVIETIATFRGDVVAQFDDEARIAGVTFSGTWTLDRKIRRSTRRAGPEQNIFHGGVGGGISTGRVSPGREPGSRPSVDYETSVTTSTDDEWAIAGNYLGLLSSLLAVSHFNDALEALQKRAWNGECARIVADPPSIRTRPGADTSIKAHFVDRDGVATPGRIKAITFVSGGSITPSEGRGAPDLPFTYTAPRPRPSDGKDTVFFDGASRAGRSGRSLEVVIEDSYTYKVMSATLAETVTGQRPTQPGYENCPPSGSQTNSMTVGEQPLATDTNHGRLIAGPQDYQGAILATGDASAQTQMKGCDVAESPPAPCTANGSQLIARDVRIDVTLPRDSGPAHVQWGFDASPSAGFGTEGKGTTCLTGSFSGTTSDQKLGSRTVDRAVFEATTPQTLSLELEFDAKEGDSVHASERYTLTIQRVAENGSPL